MDIEERKNKHIELSLKEKVETGTTYFEKMMLIPKALPEIKMSEVDCSTEFLGKRLNFPLIISGMVGGTQKAKEINRKLAKAAQDFNIAFGVGSQRIMIEKPELSDTFKTRDVAPDIPILANIGVVQAGNFSNDELKEVMHQIGADALCLHVNAAQEIFQAKGDEDFENCIKTFKRVAKDIPVVAKGVGQGFDRDTAIKLQGAGVKALEIAGSGGTNWIKIDGMISGQDFSTFENWGLPTACSVIECRKTVPLIASGGIRTGLDMAKAIALGADYCGMALPLLKAAEKNEIEKLLVKLESEFRIAMYLCGCKTVKDLKKAEHVLFNELKQFDEQRAKYQENIKM